MLEQKEHPGGYRAPQVCNLVGITYRQLDYWARTGLNHPVGAVGTRQRFSAALLVR